MKMPLNVMVHKDKILVMSNGGIQVKPSIELKVILPEYYAGRSGVKKFKGEEGLFYFIGAKKYTIGSNNPAVYDRELGQDLPDIEFPLTNIKCRGISIMLDHTAWQDSVAKMLPYGYTEYMMITEKEKLSKYAHTGTLKAMYFDIEVASDGTGVFPRATRNAVAMIGFKFVEIVRTPEGTLDFKPIKPKLDGIKAWEGKDDVYILDSYDPNMKGVEDTQILKDFDSLMLQNSPDIIVSYNGWSFDVPYIVNRYRVTAQDFSGFTGISKEEKEKYPELASYSAHSSDPENAVNIGSFGTRVHYDIYSVDVIRDGLLTGLKNRKMKTIAQYFYPKADDIILLDNPELENIAGMMATEEGKEKLRIYLHSDVRQTERLAQVYFPTNINQAEQLEVPLGVIVNRRNGTIPTFYLLRELLAERMIPVATNTTVFEPFIKRSMEVFGEDSVFQGAYVGILQPQTKFPHPISKIDFSGLYPNVARTFNLSYETIYMWIEPLKESHVAHDTTREKSTAEARFSEELKFEKVVNDISDDLDSYDIKPDDGDGYLRISYNDKVLHCRIHIKVNMMERGVLPKILDKVLLTRKGIKKEMKKIDKKSTQYKVKDSEQLFYKIIANSIYGILSQKSGIGFLPVGMTITAMGRYVTKQVCKELDREGNTLLTRLADEPSHSVEPSSPAAQV